MDASIVLGVVSLFVLILVNAFFVFAEYSVAVSRKTRIAEWADKGHAQAKLVLSVMQDPDQFFAATQVGVTITSLAVGALSEPAFSRMLGGFFAGLGMAVPFMRGAAAFLGAVGGLLIASYFQIVLAELVPRSITLRAAERVALIVVPPMNTLATLFRPFVWLLKGSSRGVLRALGFRPDAEAERLHTLEELRMLIEASERGGAIESERGEMLSKVFTFGDTTVREVMIPRTEMICVNVEASLQEVGHLFSTHAYSRLPVYEESLDHIVGVLHIKDLLRALLSPTRMPSVRQLMREPFFVPDTQRADELLQQFRARHEYMAVVLDEYGGTAGLVTLSDLVARIIGEIGDAVAPALLDIQPAGDGSVLINGLMTIGDVNDAFGLKLEDPNYDTIGGFVMGQLGRIPVVGDSVELKSQGVALSVEEMDKLRVARLRLRRIADPGHAGKQAP
ncbi:MAG: membrane protein [Candidatus Roseilinea sp.]|nr:MAG: membrane protein [Candidatus Roseilinea sp.]